MADFSGFNGILENLTPETAVLEAAALAIALSKGKDSQFLSLLSNFFLVLGDSLGLISTKTDMSAAQNTTGKSPESNSGNGQKSQ